jgi:glycerophosphoryl diester phosphodiesterase
LRVNTWTVNESDEMRRLIEAGVDGSITNKPDVLRDVLREA